jgi:hypothetical protein
MYLFFTQSAMVSVISLPWIKADSAFLHLIGGIHYLSLLFPYPVSSGVPLLLTSVHLFLLFLLLLASLSAVAGFVCAGIPAFAGAHTVLAVLLLLSFVLFLAFLLL